MDESILKGIDTTLAIEFDSVDEARMIYNSIKPEIEFESNDRSITNIELDKKTVKLVIQSKDAVSLRASINSYIRWIELSTKILKI
ncbi:MAG: hypothetical protein BZ136_06210 [Methanosphaera sp. rholeuAM74]|nr:MAG: hypothetical protein BZ136_06210 [Methanosphaera sp. rholeuAM74]